MNKDITLKIMYLYPNEMNIYGDHGNLQTLQKRCQWRGIKTEYISHEPGQDLDESANIIIGGGGQDSGQDRIHKDLIKNGAILRKMAKNGTPMLMICGMYQLFGHYFETSAGHRINGIGIFDAQTKAGENRLIGNIITETEFGKTVGYENHSGLTYLNEGQKPFGKVIKGAGNNGDDNTEGAIINNVIGSYLHGPLLPKNPELADYLIKVALKNKGIATELSELDESITNKARDIASRRPR